MNFIPAEYITRDPFPVCNLPEFLIEDSATTEETERVKGRSFIEELQQELGELNYHKKNNDLYQFSQVAYGHWLTCWCMFEPCLIAVSRDLHMCNYILYVLEYLHNDMYMCLYNKGA